MLMILGVRLKLVNDEEYCTRVWLLSSLIVINSVMSVDDGSEKVTGMSTA
jgi:hypothetical protein